MAHPQHEQVRQRYKFRCGYCGVSEADAGGRLTVDHFQPVSQGGDESEDNLVHACFKCNQFKGDFAPNADDVHNHRHVLHPLIDDVDRHVRFKESNGTLEPLTETGRFHIALLQLNRPELVKSGRLSETSPNPQQIGIDAAPMVRFIPQSLLGQRLLCALRQRAA